jgi:uncharacterized membrane protein
MSALRDLAAGPWGVVLAIFEMMVATYLCRASGVVLMSRVTITPRVERALGALPGSIVVATILPLALDGGGPAILSLGAAIVVMSLVRFELLALLAGLATITILRSF